MNHYVIFDIRKLLSSEYIIECQMVINRKIEKNMNSEIENLEVKIEKIHEEKLHNKNIILSKINSLISENDRVFKEYQIKEIKIIYKLDDLYKRTLSYNSKTKIRNLKKQIPDSDDIKGAYIDRPKEISGYELELYEIRRELDEISKKNERYNKLRFLTKNF